jgi:phage gp46-like protein
VDLKYAQKYIDEALQWLMKEDKIKKKDVGKKAFYIAVTNEMKDADSKRVLRNRIKEIAEIEKADQ